MTCHDRSERDPGVSLKLPHQFAPVVSLTFFRLSNRTIEPRLTTRGAPVPGTWYLHFSNTGLLILDVFSLSLSLSRHPSTAGQVPVPHDVPP